MKTSNFFITALFLVFIAANAIPAYSNNNPGPESQIIFKVKKGDHAKQIVIQLANLNKQRTSVKLESYDGTVWFVKTIKGEYGFATKYNLSKLPDGAYFLKVSNKTISMKWGFEIDPGEGVLLNPGSDRPAPDMEEAITDLTSNN